MNANKMMEAYVSEMDKKDDFRTFPKFYPKCEVVFKFTDHQGSVSILTQDQVKNWVESK